MKHIENPILNPDPNYEPTTEGQTTPLDEHFGTDWDAFYRLADEVNRKTAETYRNANLKHRREAV